MLKAIKSIYSVLVMFKAFYQCLKRNRVIFHQKPANFDKNSEFSLKKDIIWRLMRFIPVKSDKTHLLRFNHV